MSKTGWIVLSVVGVVVLGFAAYMVLRPRGAAAPVVSNPSAPKPQAASLGSRPSGKLGTVSDLLSLGKQGLDLYQDYQRGSSLGSSYNF